MSWNKERSLRFAGLLLMTTVAYLVILGIMAFLTLMPEPAGFLLFIGACVLWVIWMVSGYDGRY